MAKRTASVVFKLMLIVFILAALSKEIYVNGGIIIGAFYYFTIQSNILVVLSLLILIFLTKKSRTKHIIRGIALLAITLTGIIYNFVLYKIYSDWGTVAYTYSRTFLHVVAPLGFILDWLIFDEHGAMKVKDIFIWLIYPAIYCLISLYAGLRYDFSLYFFFNVASGYDTVGKWIGILLCTLLAISLIYVGVDKFVGYEQKTHSWLQ